MTIKNKDIQFGTVEISPDEFESRNVKVRVTTMIDEDVLNELRDVAETKDTKYQTLINQILRQFVEGLKGRSKSPLSEDKVRQIVREELKKRA